MLRLIPLLALAAMPGQQWALGVWLAPDQCWLPCRKRGCRVLSGVCQSCSPLDVVGSVVPGQD